MNLPGKEKRATELQTWREKCACAELWQQEGA